MEDVYEYKITEFDIETNYIDFFSQKFSKANKKYMLISIKNVLFIYDFSKKLFLDDMVKTESNIALYYYDFHTNNDNIFFICKGNEVILYEISNIKLNIINIIQSLFTDVIYGCFSPYESNMFLSVSDNGCINIYDISNSLPICLIKSEELFNFNSEIKWNKKYIGFKKKNSVIYFEYDNYQSENIKKYISEGIADFYYLNKNDDALIIIKKKIYEIIKGDKKLYEFNETIISSYYYSKANILILINSKNIKGIKIDDNYKINHLFNFEQNLDNYISKPLFIKENLLNKNEICEIYENPAPFTILSYSIIDKNITEQNIKNENGNKIDVKKIKKMISDIPLLLSKDNNANNYLILPENPNNKNYLKIECINKELDVVKKRSFLERKNKVINVLKQYDEKKDIKQQYIFLLELLINDNTNKDLLKPYLNLIKDKGEELQSIFGDNFVEFKDEFNLFSKAFTHEKNLLYFKSNVKSQKDEFNMFLKTISDLQINKNDDIQIFKNDLKGYDKYFENVCYFNMPIDISNEELFYYRSINIIKYHLKVVNDRINKQVKENIQLLNDSKDKIPETEKNELIENFRNNLFKYELDKINNNIKLCIDDLKNSNDLKLINELVISLCFAEEKELFNCCYKYIKLENKNIDNILQQNKDDESIINIFDNYKKVDIDLSLIKKFYKNILPLQCFKSIFLDLNGKDTYYPFEDEKFTEYFVENHFEILDVPIKTSIGLTDKFTMKIYFIPFMSQIIFEKGLILKNEKNIMKNGFFIRVGNHEIGHNFTNINFYMENCQIPITTPRKKTFDEIEGGYYIDYALFGEILREINLKQALYILNEKNYEKTYLDFQYGFKDIKEEDLKVEGVFKEMCENIINNINPYHEDNYKSIYISLNPSGIKENKIKCEISNDVIYGNEISDEE